MNSENLQSALSQEAPDDIFSPIPGAVVNIVIPASINVGDTFSNTVTGLSVPVTAGTRLLLVSSATGGGLLVGGAVVGYISAGLGID